METIYTFLNIFVGRWAYLDSREKELTAWIASPLLFFILMAGPLGFLLYLLGRTAVLYQQKTDRRQHGQ